MKTIFEKAYLIKAQAEKAAEKEFGAEWETKVFIDKSDDCKKYVVRESNFVIRSDIAAERESKANVSLAEALAESGETIEELKDDGHSAAADALANATMAGAGGKVRFSTIKSPVKRVWDIADSMPKASRKEVVEECVRQGVASGTARTQYQAWFRASQDSNRDDIRKPYEK